MKRRDFIGLPAVPPRSACPGLHLPRPMPACRWLMFETVGLARAARLSEHPVRRHWRAQPEHEAWIGDLLSKHRKGPDQEPLFAGFFFRGRTELSGFGSCGLPPSPAALITTQYRVGCAGTRQTGPCNRAVHIGKIPSRLNTSARGAE
jgi:hypothetical protein